MKKICSFLLALLFLVTLTFAVGKKNIPSNDYTPNLCSVNHLLDRVVYVQFDEEQNTKMFFPHSDLQPFTNCNEKESAVHRRGHRIRRGVRKKAKKITKIER